MNLGNILAQAGGTPLTGRPVRFKLITADSQKNLVENEVEAVLFPVTERQRADLVRAARDYCSERDMTEGSATFGELLHPEANLQDEVTYRFLLAALRDPEDARAQWATNDQLPLLRKGLVQQQCIWLGQEYDAYLADQYPELRGMFPTPADAARVKAEAKATF
jgi:hypothetical protein